MQVNSNDTSTRFSGLDSHTVRDLLTITLHTMSVAEPLFETLQYDLCDNVLVYFGSCAIS